MKEDTSTGWQEAYAAGQREAALALEVKTVAVPGRRDPIPFLLVPAGFQAVDLERFTGEREDREAEATFPDVASFLAYVAQFRTPETILFGDAHAGTVTAYLDYHAAGEAGLAGTNRHQATLRLRFTPEWTAWTGVHNRAQSQVGFAEFLEEHIPEIVEPDGAKVLTAAQNLESKKAVDFKQAVSLSNGLVQLKYEEKEIGAGSLSIPSELVLGLAPYEAWGAGFEPAKQPVRALLRYRIQDQKLSFIVRLLRTEYVLRDAFREVLAAVESASGLTVLLGSVAGVG